MTILERLLNSIAPFECLDCGTEGAIVCQACMPHVAQPLPGVCYRCHAAIQKSLVCQSCSRTTALRRVWACSAYAGLAKNLVHVLKFGRARAAADPMVAIMDTYLPRCNDWVVVPVPTATGRVRERGYDQAELLARRLSRCRLLCYAPVIRRLGHTRQLGAGRSVRKHQLQGAYRVTRQSLVCGKHVLLVDDVMTTGASLEAAAECLRRAGAATVSAVVFAYKQ